MTIEIVYFDGCPNWKLAQQRVLEALSTMGHANTEVRLHLVENPLGHARIADDPCGRPGPVSDSLGRHLVVPLVSDRRRFRGRSEHRSIGRGPSLETRDPMRDPEIHVPRLAGVPGRRGTVRISSPYLGRRRRGIGNETWSSMEPLYTTLLSVYTLTSSPEETCGLFTSP